MRLLLLLATVLTLASTALGWGAAGHEIIATIAQIHLYPSVREKLCDVLPEKSRCHLATVAAWADTVRRYYPETAPMHYINRESIPPTTISDDTY